MAEYIEREELMKFPIRRNHYDKEHGNEHFIYGIETVLEYAENLPSADVAPVVRCKYCKHQCKIWHADKRMKEKGYWIYSCKRNSDPFVSHTVNGFNDEYCCYGERKKGENDE